MPLTNNGVRVQLNDFNCFITTPAQARPAELSAQKKFVGCYEVVSMSAKQSGPAPLAHFLFSDSIPERRLAA